MSREELVALLHYVDSLPILEMKDYLEKMPYADCVALLKVRIEEQKKAGHRGKDKESTLGKAK